MRTAMSPEGLGHSQGACVRRNCRRTLAMSGLRTVFPVTSAQANCPLAVRTGLADEQAPDSFQQISVRTGRPILAATGRVSCPHRLARRTGGLQAASGVAGADPGARQIEEAHSRAAMPGRCTNSATAALIACVAVALEDTASVVGADSVEAVDSVEAAVSVG